MGDAVLTRIAKLSLKTSAECTALAKEMDGIGLTVAAHRLRVLSREHFGVAIQYGEDTIPIGAPPDPGPPPKPSVSSVSLKKSRGD